MSSFSCSVVRDIGSTYEIWNSRKGYGIRATDDRLEENLSSMSEAAERCNGEGPKTFHRKHVFQKETASSSGSAGTRVPSCYVDQRNMKAHHTRRIGRTPCQNRRAHLRKYRTMQPSRMYALKTEIRSSARRVGALTRPARKMNLSEILSAKQFKEHL